MAYYAKVINGIVDKVIIADVEFFDTFADDSPGKWLETSITGDIRKNYAGIGYTCDATRDAFIPPKPLTFDGDIAESFVLNEETCQWQNSVPYPSDGVRGDEKYYWSEKTLKFEVGPEGVTNG